jgi:type I restriction enzyme, S subunit
VIPRVPSHWRTCRLKDVARFIDDALSETTDPEFEFRYIDIGNVSSAGHILGEDRVLFAEAPSRARRRVKPGDSILSTVRTYLRAVALIEPPTDDLIVSTGFAVLRPEPLVEPAFLWRVLQSEFFIQSVVANSDGVSYPAISPDDLMALPFWYPPNISEQRQLVGLANEKTELVDALLNSISEEARILSEYRRAVISAAAIGLLMAGEGNSRA